jgi:hypothetical protein
MMVERRLRQIKMRGRNTKTTTLGNGDECLQPKNVDLHAKPLPA